MSNNRVEDAVTGLRAKMAHDPDFAEKVRSLDGNMAIDFAEHTVYQTAQSRAFAAGTLSLDEAQTVYVALGELHSSFNGGWARDVDTATKIVVTRLIAELVG